MTIDAVFFLKRIGHRFIGIRSTWYYYRLTFSIALAVLVLVAPSVPADANTAKAKMAFAQASKFYSQSKFQEAIEKFNEAYATKPHPSIFYNLGKCYAKLNQPAKALQYFRNYVKEVPNGPDINDVSESIIAMERALREKGVQQVLVLAAPTQAQIEIDGKVLGVSPVFIELPAGKHTIVVSAATFETSTKTLDLSLVRSAEVSVKLRALSDVPKKELVALTPTEKSKIDVAIVVPNETKKPRVFTWVAAGLAVVAGGAGAVTTVMNLDAQSKAKDESARLKAGQSLMQLDEQMKQTNTIATASFIGAGVAGAAAIVLFIVEGN
jgi:tetratricopeptide (TPR) repeat protein